jgi:hypothetical protein
VVGERELDRRSGGLRLALREPEQRQAGLRVEPELPRPGERLLGPRQVAALGKKVAHYMEKHYFQLTG